jgi:hypothetical protein
MNELGLRSSYRGNDRRPSKLKGQQPLTAALLFGLAIDRVGVTGS